jgi:hypothetical protein
MNHETHDSSEPTQKTPDGLEIPVPKKGDVFRDLTKAAKPRKRRLWTRRSQKER